MLSGQQFEVLEEFTLELCQSDHEKEFQDVLATDIVLKKGNN